MTAASRQPPRYPTIHLAVFTYAGVEPDTMSCIVQELFQAAQREIPIQLSHHSEDALISRSRSRALSVLTRPASDGSPPADVMVMVDRDIAWQIGDVADIACAAVEKQALVGGICSYRQMAGAGGIASRLAGDDTGANNMTEVRIGGLAFHPATYLGSGFLAIPRAVVERVLRECSSDAFDGDYDVMKAAPAREYETLRISKCAPMQKGDVPFYDFFRPVSVPRGRKGMGHPDDSATDYLSEDWAFCYRAAKAGVPLLLWEKPIIRHWGRVPMTVPMPKKADAKRIVEP